ncbi:hypothetical protein EDD96_5056 [Streptomyces sp. Ag109_G2-6]|nr:hypothetical protein EDD96_5056 [Streptomyces sp. Ag109_G2-6]
MTVKLTKNITIPVIICLMIMMIVGYAAFRPTNSAKKAEASVPAPVAQATDLLDRVTRFTSEFGVRGGYRTPTEAERSAVLAGISSLLDGDVEKGRTRLAGVDYRLDTFTDGPGGRRYAEVADAAARSGSANRGWGRVYVDLGAPVRWSVQVPHPIADQDTERLGVAVLRGTPGGVMVLAGAHRKAAGGPGGGDGEGEEGDGAGDANAAGAGAGSGGGGGGGTGEADMAHRTDSVFHAVIAELTRRGLPGIQLHGFADSTVPGAGAVVSTGAGDAAAADAARLADELASRGVRPCRAWSTGCRMSGRGNAQGRLAAELATRFLHLELARSVRADPGRRDEVARAIAYVTAGWAGA